MSTQLPNDSANDIRLGPTEPIVSTVLNRGLLRLFQNDEYLSGFIGKAFASESDNIAAYLTEKILPGTGIVISADTTANGEVLRINAGTVSGAEISGIQATGSVTDDNLVVWDGATGGFVKDTGITITDISDLQTDVVDLSADTAAISAAVSGAAGLDTTFIIQGTIDEGANKGYIESTDPTHSIASDIWDSRTDSIYADWSFLPITIGADVKKTTIDYEVEYNSQYDTERISIPKAYGSITLDWVNDEITAIQMFSHLRGDPGAEVQINWRLKATISTLPFNIGTYTDYNIIGGTARASQIKIIGKAIHELPVPDQTTLTSINPTQIVYNFKNFK
jgi:hypothetical protein